jgi:hypothetical protein
MGKNICLRHGSVAACVVLLISVASASAVPPISCRADVNQNGSIEIADVFDFLDAWFAGDPSTNFDGVNGLQIADIFAFLDAWFAGC